MGCTHRFSRGSRSHAKDIENAGYGILLQAKNEVDFLCSLLNIKVNTKKNLIFWHKFSSQSNLRCLFAAIFFDKWVTNLVIKYFKNMVKYYVFENFKWKCRFPLGFIHQKKIIR